MREPEIYGGKLMFTQAADSCNSGTQELEIEVLDAGDGKYMILKTEGWAIDSLKDLEEIMERCKTAFGFNDSKDGSKP